MNELILQSRRIQNETFKFVNFLEDILRKEQQSLLSEEVKLSELKRTIQVIESETKNQSVHCGNLKTETKNLDNQLLALQQAILTEDGKISKLAIEYEKLKRDSVIEIKNLAHNNNIDQEIQNLKDENENLGQKLQEFKIRQVTGRKNRDDYKQSLENLLNLSVR